MSPPADQIHGSTFQPDSPLSAKANTLLPLSLSPSASRSSKVAGAVLTPAAVRAALLYISMRVLVSSGRP